MFTHVLIIRHCSNESEILFILCVFTFYTDTIVFILKMTYFLLERATKISAIIVFSFTINGIWLRLFLTKLYSHKNMFNYSNIFKYLAREIPDLMHHNIGGFSVFLIQSFQFQVSDVS